MIPMEELTPEDSNRYVVSANRSQHFSESFATPEDAIDAASRLIREGYAVVSVRDLENDGDVW